MAPVQRRKRKRPSDHDLEPKKVRTSMKSRRRRRNEPLVHGRSCLTIIISMVLVLATLILVLVLNGTDDSSNANHRSLRGRGRHASLSDARTHQESEDDKKPWQQIMAKLLAKEDVESQLAPLDNYYSRKHILGGKEQMQEQQQEKMAVLIVGGSDGSGTRAFVDTLGRLGVPMLVDDTRTYDVHATKLFGGEGWPPLVLAVLDANAGMNNTANYEFESLPESVKNLVMYEMRWNFQEIYQQRADTLLATALAKNRSVTSNVQYGFKAPVTMLLLPILQQLYGRIKFLHVVRDGRDVALSENQSPVKKFYNHFYHPHDAENRRLLYETKHVSRIDSVQAIDLWNDWNTQVHEWEQQHNNGDTFDYLVMRTEDLLDPEQKFESLLQLSDFVGSPRTERELCCVSRQALVDMGQSGTRHRRQYSTSMPLANLTGGGVMLTNGSFIPTGPAAQFESNIEDIHESWNHALSSLDKQFEENTKILDQNIKNKRPELYERLQQDREKRQNEKLVRREARFQALYQQERKTSALVHGNQQNNSSRRATSRDLKSSDNVVGFGQAIVEAESSRESNNTDRLNDRKVLIPGFRYYNHNHTPFLTPRKNGNASDASGVLLEDSAEAHGFVRKTAPEAVKKRYGKWVFRLGSDPDLSSLLHQQGAAALKEFGYEPPRRFRDELPTTRGASSFQCDETVVCEYL